MTRTTRRRRLRDQLLCDLFIFRLFRIRIIRYRKDDDDSGSGGGDGGAHAGRQYALFAAVKLNDREVG